MESDDATARPDARDRVAGRRRADSSVTFESVSAARERVADALSRPDGHRVGQDILGVLRAQSPPPPHREVEKMVPRGGGNGVSAAPPAAAAPLRATPAPRATEDDWWGSEQAAPPVRTERVAPAVGISTTVRFPPKRGARRLMATVLLLVLIATAVAGYLAYDDPTTLTIGVTATLGLLLLITWAIRAGTPLTRMAVKGGLLEIKQGGLLLKFDLTSHFTPVDVQGAPGRRDWRVLFGHGTARPFVVDSSIVDPTEFMEVLLRYRPQ